MTKVHQRALSAIQVAAAIVTMHYGLGMLIGTGQDIARFGPTGMIYAISTSLGTLAILCFANFYWQKFAPIWDLFEIRYGKNCASFTAFLSSFWMIGVVASFLVSGQAAAAVFNIPNNISVAGILLAIYAFSLINYGWLSTMFFTMLIFGSIFLLATLFQIDIDNFFLAPYLFLKALPGPSLGHLLSVLTSTVLLTAIGMDFHQFIVRAKSAQTARMGIIIAAGVLFFISFLLGGIILGSLVLLGERDLGAETLPAILAISGRRWLGNFWGIFVLPVIFVAIGSGSGLLKIISVSVGVFFQNKLVKNKYLTNALLLVIAFLISLTSRSVIGLIISFYAIYVGAVLAPFLFYRFDKGRYSNLRNGVFLAALATGFTNSVIVFVSTSIFGFGNSFEALLIIISGSISSGLILLTGRKT